MTEQQNKYQSKNSELLVGQVIEKVYYQELTYDGDEFWELSSEIHSVDLNIIFQLNNGKLIELVWDNEFYSYGIAAKVIEKISVSENLKTVEVTNNSKWEEVLNSKIVDFKVLWDNGILHRSKRKFGFTFTSKNIPISVPQTWQLSFENGAEIWVSAFQIRENEEHTNWADNLTVFFSRSIKEQYL